MTDTVPARPTERLPAAPSPTLADPPASPLVSTPGPVLDGDLAALTTAFRLFQVQHARVLHHESASRGLNATDARFVLFLANADGAGVTPKQAGAFLELSTGAMTSLIDRLELHGHIERRPNPGDRRSVLLHLTASGAAVAQQIGSVWSAAFRDVVPQQDRHRLAATLEELGAALDRHSRAVVDPVAGPALLAVPAA